MKKSSLINFLCIPVIFFVMLLESINCSKGSSSLSGNPTINPSTNNDNYIVFAWNDLGMHCLNPTYNSAVILPPYNTLWAQVVKRGINPEIVTTGITVSYHIINNTYSYGKIAAATGGDYRQFWDNCLALFGAALSHDKGLNLEDPDIHNGLSGDMLLKTDHFQVNGIPLVPVDDSGVWNPYQVAEITVYDSSNNVLAQTRTTIPTSDEINCARAECHAFPAMEDVLQKHDDEEGTSLLTSKPVLCASCHGSPALGGSGAGSSGKYLSEAIHGFHSDKNAVCYDCHPGLVTKCSRSVKHTSSDGNCNHCHGTMSNVADTITAGTRTPWLNEPQCLTCHAGVAEVDTSTTLYRNANSGHSGIYCIACHGSPHAMTPSSKDSDNYQAVQYQSKAKTIGSCGVCHDDSRGEGSSEFLGEHGGSSEQPSACNVCHTQVNSNNIALWPHQYQWHNTNN